MPGGAAIRLLRITYPSSPEEPPRKIYDYSQTTFARRWRLGLAAGGAPWNNCRPAGAAPGLQIADVAA
jgi:hypothetical protein